MESDASFIPSYSAIVAERIDENEKQAQCLRASGTGPGTNASCQMACCAMSNTLGAITKPPNGNLVNGSFGSLVVETSTIRHRTTSHLTVDMRRWQSP